MAIDWGNAPNWVAASAASAALIAAGITLRRDRHRLGLLEKEADERARDRRMQQAGQVTLLPTGEFVPDRERAPRNRFYQSVTISNASTLPIIEIFIEIQDGAGATTTIDSGIPIVAPGEQRTTTLPGEYREILGEQLIAMVRLRFADALGRRWLRYANGRLVFLDWSSGQLREIEQ